MNFKKISKYISLFIPLITFVIGFSLVLTYNNNTNNIKLDNNANNLNKDYCINDIDIIDNYKVNEESNSSKINYALVIGLTTGFGVPFFVSLISYYVYDLKHKSTWLTKPEKIKNEKIKNKQSKKLSFKQKYELKKAEKAKKKVAKEKAHQNKLMQKQAQKSKAKELKAKTRNDKIIASKQKHELNQVKKQKRNEIKDIKHQKKLKEKTLKKQLKETRRKQKEQAKKTLKSNKQINKEQKTAKIINNQKKVELKSKQSAKIDTNILKSKLESKNAIKISQLKDKTIKESKPIQELAKDSLTNNDQSNLTITFKPDQDNIEVLKQNTSMPNSSSIISTNATLSNNITTTNNQTIDAEVIKKLFADKSISKQFTNDIVYYIIMAYGGPNNILDVTASFSKLKVQVLDLSQVNMDLLTQLGSLKTYGSYNGWVYATFGNKSKFIKNNMKELLSKLK